MVFSLNTFSSIKILVVLIVVLVQLCHGNPVVQPNQVSTSTNDTITTHDIPSDQDPKTILKVISLGIHSAPSRQSRGASDDCTNGTKYISVHGGKYWVKRAVCKNGCKEKKVAYKLGDGIYECAVVTADCY
ncbi:uncharacterized protein LOC125570166 [Nematostella vectensis]|uniref:uncharacterized protein LOC125570166 n=1 Tax=Nematostella vectensis TaxID=45351 RepID=UPI002077571B|nr:uncharacterized protein LOC125570166 [Nematostella vectensis]